MQPTSYIPQTDFQEEEQDAVAGRSTVRTAMVDAELQAISLTFSQVLANLAVIQRDDTALQDAIVTTSSLSANVKALFGVGGITARGAWLTATAYAVKDIVETGTPLTSYVCVIAHTSGVFATDRAAGKWMVLGAEPGTGSFTTINLSTGGITLSTNGSQDLAATANRFRSGYFGTTVFADVSVVTPLVGPATDVAFNTKAAGVNTWLFQPSASNYDLIPAFGDATQSIGRAISRIKQVFTPIIDSGTAGSLSLKTNNGTPQVTISNTGTVTFAGGIQGASATWNIVTGNAVTDNFDFYSGVLDGTTAKQFQILGMTGSTRNITVTGSNGGNPTIDVTGGSLAITPSIVVAGGATITGASLITGLLRLGANGGATGSLGISYATSITTRDNTGVSDLGLIGASTVNGVTNVVTVGADPGPVHISVGVIWRARSGGAPPTTSDLPASHATVWRDTVGATTKIYYNNAGAIIASAAFA